MRTISVLFLTILAIACAETRPGDPEPDEENADEAAREATPAPLIRRASAEPHLAPALEYAPAEPPSADVAEAREAIRAILERAHAGQPIRVGGESVSAGLVLLRFYEARDFLPAFYDAEGAPRAASIAAVRAAADGAAVHGLRPADYHAEALGRADGSEPEALAVHDLLLSDTFLTLGSHLLKGKVDPLTIFPTWTARQRAADLLDALRVGLASDRIGEALEAVVPSDDGYLRLREALERYRGLARTNLPDPGGAPWAATPARLAAVQRHLEARGDWMDGDLEGSVRRFQTRHGLPASGEVDALTLDALRVPLEERVETLRVNLDRWRWLPEDLGERQVRVNIAGFEMRYIEAGDVRLRMRAIVGKTYRSTPVFSDTIRYLVLNPTWTVPSTVFREDLLPEVRRDRRVLERRGLEVLSREGRAVDPAGIEWGRVRHGEVYFRQPPGPNNALGPVKFMFPNPHDVYLHGTPRQDLFEEAERAFSSGCIRLERPLELAAQLLADQPSYGREAIDRIVQTRRSRTVHLTTPLPVHLLYSTAWVEADGTLHFRRDIYERDAGVANALGSDRPAPLARATVVEASSG